LVKMLSICHLLYVVSENVFYLSPLQYSRANSREEKRDLFFVIFDYVVHQINEACLAGGISTYTYDDAQPLASLLAFADAPEAFYISVKHGVEGVGDMLRKAISAALSQSAQYDQLNVVLSTVCFNYMLYVNRLRYNI
jgi:hypothetical protein